MTLLTNQMDGCALEHGERWQRGKKRYAMDISSKYVVDESNEGGLC